MTDPQTPSALKFWQCHCPEYNNHSVGAWKECSRCGAKPPASPQNPETPELDLHTDIEKVKKMDTSDWFEENSSGVTSQKCTTAPVQQNPEMEKIIQKIRSYPEEVQIILHYIRSLESRNALLEEENEALKRSMSFCSGSCRFPESEGAKSRMKNLKSDLMGMKEDWTGMKTRLEFDKKIFELFRDNLGFQSAADTVDQINSVLSSLKCK